MSSPTDQKNPQTEQLGEKSAYPQATDDPSQYLSDTPAEKSAPAAPQPALWENIPQGLKECRQWCLAGPDKRPLTADGRAASVTNPATWCDFDTAASAAQTKGMYIGFILTADDPFTCIDLDVKQKTPQEHLNRFKSIIETFDTHTECSRSGEGWHVWCTGGSGSGVRRDGVEVYSQERFIICTGDTTRAAPIRDRSELVSQLVGEIRKAQGGSTDPTSLEEQPEDYNDWEILERALNAGNADKFNDLYEGRWDTYIEYPSQSEADLSLMSMFAFYSRSNEQCRRLFRGSALGKREKASKNDRYLNRTLKVIRGRQLKDSKKQDDNEAHGSQIADNLINNELRKLLNTKYGISTVVETNDANFEVSIADVFTQPPEPASFFIQDLLPAGVLTLLGAHGGTGKSMLALIAATCLATGRTFMGKRTKKSKVLFWSAEDPAQVVRHRVSNICRHMNIAPDYLSENLTIIDATNDPTLYGEVSKNGVRGGKITSAYEFLKAKADAIAADIIIIDNASDTYDANENERTRVREFVRTLVKVGKDRKSAVLLLAHIDKQAAKGFGQKEDYSGSTAWHNSARSRLYLSNLNGDLVLEQQKSNLGPKSAPIRLKWNERGILELGEPDASPEEAKEIILNLIKNLYERGEFVSTSPTSSTNPYKVLSEEEDYPHSLNRNGLKSALRQLEKEELLQRERYKDSNRKDRERWKVI